MKTSRCESGATMCPVLLLLLAVLNPESTVALPDNTTGQKFIVVFPENIAYYHPIPPHNKVIITALHDNTLVNIIPYTYGNTQVPLNAGGTNVYTIDARMELARANISNTTLQITSNNDINVQAISYRNNSVQTALVLPADKLGTSYLIPPIPNIPGTTDINVTIYVTERAPFRLIIVNADVPNTVTVGGGTPQVVELQPYQAAQIWLQKQDALQTVTANNPVGVLLGHSCAMRENCTCGMLYTPLSPTQGGTMKFFIPPVLSMNANNTVLLLADQRSIVTLNPDSPQIESASTVILYRPGLLLSLLAESDFASCFVVNSIVDMQTSAVILVNKDYTDGIYLGNSPLPSPLWQTLKGTDYVWTQFSVALDKSVIWHSSYTMAVYFGGTKGSAVFGNPAPIISKTPDYRGCVLTPELLEIGQDAISWTESVQYCKNRTLELISVSTAVFQKQAYKVILQIKSDSEQDLWIGMRRSSQTGDWYWLNGNPVTDTDWGLDEPGAVDAGQCAMMSLSSSTNFTWRDEDCCGAAYPICYRKPVLLPV